jgi:pimeloyl-ACP methyl ester carboxylesterase
MAKGIRLALACAVALSVSLPAVAQAQQPPPLPPGCQTGQLPTSDLQHPVQLILICLPPVGWNGQVVVYAHGYVAPQTPLSLPLDELILPDANGQLVFVPAVLLSRGFAFATTSYRKNGYAIEQGGNDLQALVEHVNTQVASHPADKVFVAGGSEGGLITTMLVERQPDTYAGGLVLCGPVGGAPFQIKYLGDFRVVFDYFFPEVFPFGAANVPPEAFEDWESAYVPAITQAILRNPLATEQLFNVTRAARDPGDPTGSAIATALGVLFYSIFGTNDLIATAGGMAYDNRFTFYQGSNNDVALNLGVERVKSDRGARRYIRRFYQTTGDLDRPLVTLHTRRDPAVPFTHELLYLGLVILSGHSDHLTVLPVDRYGHCNFTVEEVLGAFTLLLLQSGGDLDTRLADYLPSLPQPYRGDE